MAAPQQFQGELDCIRLAQSFPNGKISIHTRKGEPAAQYPTYGSQDFCLIVDGDLQEVKEELETKHANIISDIVERHGAHGTMQSLYLRDPDGTD